VPVQWTAALAVGIPEIDHQHQELFRRAERLILALRAGDRSEVEPLVEYLTDYVAEHFDSEERLMRSVAYPAYELHQAEHARLRADVGELASRCAEYGPNPLVTLMLHNWISDWLRRHIGSSDRALARFVHQDDR
jgi:hemerythrin